MIYFTSIFEDEVTHQVMLKLYESVGNLMEYRSIPCNGKGKIKKHINAYNEAARYTYFFVITDLDNDFECAPTLINDWLSSNKTTNFLFRIAVHEIESWLLADGDNLAKYFSISNKQIPRDPDIELDPKGIIISLAKRSRKREIREAIVPIDNFASIGPEYNIKLQTFVRDFWDLGAARKRSPSLDKTIKALDRISKNSI
ncbi:MAG: DUF4276 family protein [Treponema sp.]|nr:DUF4276 family protein [Treponema sp.]